MAFDYVKENERVGEFLIKRYAWLPKAFYFIVMMVILLFGVFESNDFIYFQF